MTVTLEAALLSAITWFPKEMLDGEAVTDAIPVPLRLTVCGLFVPVSLMVSVAARELKAAGVKVTEIVQLFPEPRVDGLTGHVFVCE